MVEDPVWSVIRDPRTPAERTFDLSLPVPDAEVNRSRDARLREDLRALVMEVREIDRREGRAFRCECGTVEHLERGALDPGTLPADDQRRRNFAFDQQQSLARRRRHA